MKVPLRTGGSGTPPAEGVGPAPLVENRANSSNFTLALGYRASILAEMVNYCSLLGIAQ